MKGEPEFYLKTLGKYILTGGEAGKLTKSEQYFIDIEPDKNIVVFP